MLPVHAILCVQLLYEFTCRPEPAKVHQRFNEVVSDNNSVFDRPVTRRHQFDDGGELAIVSKIARDLYEYVCRCRVSLL